MVPNKDILKKLYSEKCHFYRWLHSLSPHPPPQPRPGNYSNALKGSFLCFLKEIKHMQVYLVLSPLIFII